MTTPAKPVLVANEGAVVRPSREQALDIVGHLLRRHGDGGVLRLAAAAVQGDLQEHWPHRS